MWVYCSKCRGGRQWDWEAGSPDLQGQKNLGGCPAQRTAEGGVRDVLSCSSAALRRMEQPACHFHRRWDTKLCCQLQGKVISSSFRKQNIQAAGTAEPEGIGITPPPLERLKKRLDKHPSWITSLGAWRWSRYLFQACSLVSRLPIDFLNKAPLPEDYFTLLLCEWVADAQMHSLRFPQAPLCMWHCREPQSRVSWLSDHCDHVHSLSLGYHSSAGTRCLLQPRLATCLSPNNPPQLCLLKKNLKTLGKTHSWKDHTPLNPLVLKVYMEAERLIPLILISS